MVNSSLISSKTISSRWKGSSELPLVNHSDYVNELSEYVEEYPKRDVLIVYGVKSIGKSRVLQSKIDEWRNEKRLVVDINLKSKYNSPAKLLQLFAQKYVEGSSRINQVPNLDSDLMNKIRKSNGMITRLTSFWIKFIAAWPFSSQKVNMDSINKIDSTQLQASIVNNLIDALRVEAENEMIGGEFIAFLNALEKEMLVGNRPILVIRNIQRLLDASAPQDTKNVFNSLFSCFEKYKDGDRNLSVILESSDSDGSPLLELQVRSSQSFFLYEVEQWTKEEGFGVLVNHFKLFDAEDYEKIWNNFGGHGGQWFALHRRLRRGCSLDEAIAKSNNATASSLTNIIYAPFGEDYDSLVHQGISNTEALLSVTEKRLEFLSILVKANFTLHINCFPSSFVPTSNFFCRQNILWVDETIIRPQRKDLENAILLYKYKL